MLDISTPNQEEELVSLAEDEEEDGQQPLPVGDQTVAVVLPPSEGA